MSLKKIHKGKLGQQIAVKWLEQRSFKVVAQNLRPPRSYAAGEIDLVAQQMTSRGINWWILEIKNHASSFESPLLGTSQKLRIYRSLWWLSQKVKRPVRFALVWVDSCLEKVEFIENP